MNLKCSVENLKGFACRFLTHSTFFALFWGVKLAFLVFSDLVGRFLSRTLRFKIRLILGTTNQTFSFD